jgi:hypothetical protein
LVIDIYLYQLNYRLEMPIFRKSYFFEPGVAGLTPEKTDLNLIRFRLPITLVAAHPF